MAAILVSLILLIQGIPVRQGGTVTGVLRDTQGTPIPGVRIAAVARGDSVEEAAAGAAMAGLAETDERGRFTLENIPPGRYAIAAGRLDLQTYYPGTQALGDATVLTISAGATIADINFVLNNTSFGRAASIGGNVLPSITALIPVRVVVEKGEKLPISAEGKFISLRLESQSALLAIPIDGTSFTIPGPVSADFRLVVDNLPETYEVKAMSFGNTAMPQGTFHLAAANFPTVRSAVVPAPPAPVAPPPGPTLPDTEQALRAYLEQLTQYRAGLPATVYSVSSMTLVPATNPPSNISITLGRVAALPGDGVRVSGSTGSKERRRVFISGKPGVVFSDGTFEFRGVSPGRHLIASPGNKAFASVVVVGDKDVEGIELKETPMLPANAFEPTNPMPAGSYAPGTTLPLARIVGTVVEEMSREPIVEGNVVIRAGNSERITPIDEKGAFESFYLLPGTYEIRFQIFGHSTNGPTITVEHKSITVELTSRRLY